MTDLAVLYEHPAWFVPLFAALDARGVEFSRATPDGFWNPADQTAPARVVFNRIAMSSFLRSDEHPIFDTMAMLDRFPRRASSTAPPTRSPRRRRSASRWS
jgi:hypothetical protein